MPGVDDEPEVANGLVQRVDAALLQQLAHDLIGDLRSTRSTLLLPRPACARVCTAAPGSEHASMAHALDAPASTSVWESGAGARLVAPLVDGGHGDVVDDHRHGPAARGPVRAALPLLHASLRRTRRAGGRVSARRSQPRASRPARVFAAIACRSARLLPSSGVCSAHTPRMPQASLLAFRPARGAPRWPAGRWRAW